MSEFGFNGLVLCLITLLFAVVIVVVNKWIRKVTNCYFFWVAIGLFWFIWLVVFRFADDWAHYAEVMRTTGFQDPGNVFESQEISSALLLDVCPFAALAMCISLVVDPTRKLARAISPIAMVGGIITLASLMSGEYTVYLTPKYIFIGDGVDDCYFIMHFLQLILPVGVLLNTPKGGWKGWLSTLAIAIIYYCYVLIAMKITGCRWNCSGLSLNDWIDGEYQFVNQIFHMPVKVIQPLGIIFLYMCASGFLALKDYVFDKKHFNYGNAYSGHWYFWYNYNKHVVQKFL